MSESKLPARDIDERALEYGVRAVKLFQYLQGQRDSAGWVIGKQFLRSATSIGANLAEAKSGETRADFVHKCSIAQKEARESKYWLRLLVAAELISLRRLGDLIKETDELISIITSIARNARKRDR